MMAMEIPVAVEFWTYFVVETRGARRLSSVYLETRITNLAYMFFLFGTFICAFNEIRTSNCD